MFLYNSCFCFFSAVCPEGFEEVDGYCYVMGDGEKTFNKATEACQEMSKKAFLVEPRTEGITNIANMYANANDKLSTLWIGLTDKSAEGDFVWETDGEPLTYKNWAHRQPNNWKGAQDCAAIIKSASAWGDMKCGSPHHYLCQAKKRKTSIHLGCQIVK